MNEFKPHSLSDNVKSVADLLPNGPVFQAKNIEDSNLRTFLKGVSEELCRAEEYINLIAQQYDIEKTEDFIKEFESSFGIPDDCFTVDGKTLEERRKQIIAKIRMNGITTRQQFIDLAAYLGFDVEIRGGAYYDVFPLKFPIHFSESAKKSRFTMIVIFKDIMPKDVFPLPFPINFSSGSSNVIRCIFDKLRPANVRIIYVYGNY